MTIMKQVLKIASISSFLLFALTVSMFAQITPTLENDPDTTEVRKGSNVVYSVDGPEHSNGDEYTWEIIGGMPSVAPSSGNGTVGNPYIINFTANLHTISVTWNADDNTASAFSGRVRVQKRSGGCISTIQTHQIFAWSAATAVITTPAPGAICNGDNVGLTVTIAFTGAPVFNLDYTVESTLTGSTVTTNQTTPDINGSTVNINIPDNLINETNADQTYRITITRMNDNFVGNGTIGGNNTYTLTVHPATSTGTITVSPGSSLQRRQ
jgi:hypothetical protein